MKFLFFLQLFILIFYSGSRSQNFTPIADTAMWVPNSNVSTMAIQDGVAYITGNFDMVGPNIPNGVIVDTVTGQLLSNFPRPNNTVTAVCPDGKGGWYIGGKFTKVGSVKRNYLAQIDSNGLVTEWNPNPSYYPDPASIQINAILVHDSTVFVGGFFHQIGGITLNSISLAAINNTNGQATGFTFENIVLPYDRVYSLAIYNNKIFVGGVFPLYPNQFLRVYDLTTGSLVPDYPQPGGTVYSLLLSGDTLIVAGAFSHLGDSTRGKIGAIDLNTKTVTSFVFPALNGSIHCTAKSGSTLYVGGDFYQPNNSEPLYACAYDLIADTLTNWKPFQTQLDAHKIISILCANGKVFLAGDLQLSDGLTLNKGACAYDSATGVLESWNPNCTNQVRVMAGYGSKIYLGGDFSSSGSQVAVRKYLAALYLGGGVSSSFTPTKSSGLIRIRGVADSSLIITSYPSVTIDSVSTGYLAALDIKTGKIKPSFFPQFNDDIYSAVLGGDSLYVGGDFTTIDGITRNHLAILNANSGALLDWNPDISGQVISIVKTESSLFISGGFDTVNGQPKLMLAKFDASGSLSSWSAPAFNGGISKIQGDDHNLYVMGTFSTVNGMERKYFAGLNTSTGTLTSWYPRFDYWSGSYADMLLIGPRVYITGAFNKVDGLPRRDIVSVDTFYTGLPTSWNPYLNWYGDFLKYHDGKIFNSGYFNLVGDEAREGFADFLVDNSSYLSGKVFQDWNSNGIQDSTELPIANCMIQISPGNVSVFTDNNGYYHTYINEGIHVVKPVLPTYYLSSSPDSTILDLQDPFEIISANFGLLPIPVHELEANITVTSFPQPGYTFYEYVTCKNNGTLIDSGILKLIPDTTLLVMSGNADSVSTDTLMYLFHDLLPGAIFSRYLTLKVPTSIVAGTYLTSYLIAEPKYPDTIPSNNIDTFSQEVVSSYDPNYKTVDPGDSVLFNSDQKLHYTIYFQNMGSANAVNIFVKDTLDENLDITTFHTIAASHPYQVQIIGREVTWTFENIQLPYVAWSESKSHGMIEYSIKPQQPIPDGTVIENSAAIIFDFNDPVITNTVTTEFIDTLFTPIITFSPSLQFCAGNSVLLQVDFNANYFYQWNWNGNEISGATSNEFIATQSGDYSLALSKAGFTKISDTVSVTVYTNPVVTFDTSFVTCIYVPAFLLTGGFPDGGIYEGQGVDFSGFFDPSSAGIGEFTITYLFTDSNGCTGIDSSTVLVDICSFVSEQQGNDALIIFPNPAQNEVTIVLPSTTNAHLEMLNVLGQEVFNDYFSSAENESLKINLKEFADGIYSIKLFDDNKTMSARLLISR